MQTTNSQRQIAMADQLLVLSNLLVFRATQAQTNGTYAIFEEHVPPLAGPPPHTHPDEEVFYVLSGNFEFVLHDLTSPFKVQQGDVIKVPSNALHTYKNVGTTTGLLLTFITPGDLEQYFRAIGTPVNEPSDLPDLSIAPDFSKMDVAKVFAIAPEHQVRFYMPEVLQ